MVIRQCVLRISYSDELPSTTPDISSCDMSLWCSNNLVPCRSCCNLALLCNGTMPVRYNSSPSLSSGNLSSDSLCSSDHVMSSLSWRIPGCSWINKRLRQVLRCKQRPVLYHNCWDRD